MTARTWWFTPPIEHIDAEAHPVTLWDYKLVYLDADGKLHPIIEGEGDLVHEYVYDGSTSYFRINVLEEYRCLLQGEVDRYNKRVTRRAIVGATAGAIALAAAVADEAYPVFGLAFLAGIGVSMGTTMMNVLSWRTREKLHKAIAKAERDAYERLR